MANLKSFLADYQNGNVKITEDISYSIYDVLRTNRRLYHAVFKDPTEPSGFKKLFIRIGYIVFDTLYRNTDIDTKDVNLKNGNNRAIPIVGMLGGAVRSHLIRTGFGEFINEVRQVGLSDGSCLVKYVNGKLEQVDLLNVVKEPYLNDLQEGSVAERMFWTWDDILAMKEEIPAETWGMLEQLHEKKEEQNDSTYIGYEMWTRGMFKNPQGDEKYGKGCIKYIDFGEFVPSIQGVVTNPENWEPQQELYRFRTPYKRKRQSELEKQRLGEWEEIYPYRQWDVVKVRGRAIGFGPFELTAGLQEYTNELYNTNRKAQQLANRGIMVHKKGINSNSLTQEFINSLDVGGVISLDNDEDISRLNVTAFTADVITSADKLFEFARMITGTTAIGTGEGLPASTPATIGAINAKTAQTTYDVVIESLSLFISGIFNDFYLAEILRELTARELVDITGDPSDLKELDAFLVDNFVYNEAERYKEQTGMYPDEEQVDAERERLRQAMGTMKGTRWASLRELVIDKLDFIATVVVNNEAYDRNVTVQNIQAMLADPNLTLSRRKLEMEKVSLMGLDPKQFEKSPEEIKQEQASMAAAMMAKIGARPGAPVPAGQEMGQAEGQIVR